MDLQLRNRCRGAELRVFECAASSGRGREQSADVEGLGFLDLVQVQLARIDAGGVSLIARVVGQGGIDVSTGERSIGGRVYGIACALEINGHAGNAGSIHACLGETHAAGSDWIQLRAAKRKLCRENS